MHAIAERTVLCGGAITFAGDTFSATYRVDEIACVVVVDKFVEITLRGVPFLKRVEFATEDDARTAGLVLTQALHGTLCENVRFRNAKAAGRALKLQVQKLTP